ncbi:MAG: alpha/beta hydrolase [Candidatus Kerfeldbacteria bacterium]|nr:alpha/beta hydrolase [Candidatus Kerfeldbacteria bacterium]
MTEHFFEERGLYYRLGGKFDAEKSIVLIHGLSGSSSAWGEFENFFSTEYRVLSFDLRGHGYSARPQKFSDYSLSHMAEDCVALMNYLNITQPIIIGHSLGSLVLFELLKAHPTLPSRVVFLAPEYNVARRVGPRIIRALMFPVRWLQHIPVRHPRGRQVTYAPRYTGTGDWNLLRMYADITATGIRSFLFATYHSFSVRCDGVAKHIQCPVLMIHGKRDTIFPVKNALELEKEFPHARAVILNNADHILVLNHAQEVLPHINTFLHEQI